MKIIFLFFMTILIGCSDAVEPEQFKKNSATLQETKTNKKYLETNNTTLKGHLYRNSNLEDYSLVGTWRCNTYIIDQNCDLTWKVSSNNTYILYFDCDRGKRLVNGTWNYSNEILTVIRNGVKSTCHISWKDKDNFILREEGIVNNYSRTSREIPSNIETTNKKQNSMICPRCNGSGYHACSLPPLSADDTKCRTDQEFANCMTTNNADKTQVTCCKCNGTGTWRY